MNSVSSALSAVQILGEQSFNYMLVDLPPGGTIITEAGAMASMDSDIDLESRLNGGIVGALLIYFLGGESIFINRFINRSNQNRRIYLSQPTPGQLLCEAINGEALLLQPGAFVACSPGIRFRIRWAGISSWLGGEGLFRLQIYGHGYVWYGSYGSIVERDVDGSLLVDTGHLLSYPPSISLQAKLAGGLFSSFFGGEGLVLHLRGKGRIKLQTRSVSGLASWLNRWFS